MSQPTSPTTPKQSYAAVVAQQPIVIDVPHTGIHTRATVRKMTINAAAASLQAAKVPTKPRTYTASSIMAAASALIASKSPKGNIPATKSPSPSVKVDTVMAKTPLPIMRMATPKAAELPKSSSTTSSVLTIGAMTLEEQMHEMRKMLEMVLKDNEEKNKKIEDLQREVVGLGKQKVDEATPTTMLEDDGDNKTASIEIIRPNGVAYDENQLEVLIANAVKTQLTGSSSSGVRYTKPYSKRIDNLRMPQGYQPPKFQQFDGKGNPKQHVAHFVETCSNAGTEGDLLVKQFVRSLKGIAFDWYTDLDAESIDSWGQLEDEFFNRFYSTRRVVSMSELTNTKQWEEEPVVDYINRWRTLCLECKDRISETSAVEMCIDGMNWELLYILKGNKPKSFQELATRAHDMEITVKGRGKSQLTFTKTATDKREYKKPEKPSKGPAKETMAVDISNTPVKISAKPKQQENKKGTAVEDFKRTRPTLKELQAKKYPFPDSDLPGMLDDLLKKGIIKLPEAKRPDEANKTNDPKYCRYHRLVSHNLENCITLKELIMRLVQEGRIVLDTDETVETNHMSATTHEITHKKCRSQECTIQFGTMEPVKVWMSKPRDTAEPKKPTSSVTLKRDFAFDLQKKVHHPDEDDDGWTLVTWRKSRKQVLPQQSLVFRRKKQMTKKIPRQATGKKKLKKETKSQVLPTDLLEQLPPAPITLRDFFPEGYLNEVAVNATSEAINSDGEESPDDEVPIMETQPKLQNDAEILDVLEALPKNEQWEQNFNLPEETRSQIAQVLLNPKPKEDTVKITKEIVESQPKCSSCNTALTFSDEDLLLGSKLHNRPLYISGYIREQKVRRILVDEGSGVNLMPKETMDNLGITMEELSDSHLVIHGFNLKTERAIGMIRVNLTVGDLLSDTLFHVIDVKTSFKLLLGRPWKHENGVITSTLHQCLKYYRNGERKINGDVKPFTKADSFFADAKFFEEGSVSNELLPSVIASTGKHSEKEARKIVQNTPETKSKAASKAGGKTLVTTSAPKMKAYLESALPILRYIPKSRRNAGEGPFKDCQSSETTQVNQKKTVKVVRQEWKAKVIIPLPNTNVTQILSPPPEGFVFQSTEERSIEGRFDPNAYRLMEKSGYDFHKPAPLGQVIKTHNQVQGGSRERIGLGYEHPAPIRISARRKEDSAGVHHTTGEEIEDEGEEDKSTLQSLSVFDRIRPSTSKRRSSVFDRMDVPMKRQNLQPKTKSSVFNRIGSQGKNNKQPPSTIQSLKPSIFSRLSTPSKSVFNRLGAHIEAREPVKEKKVAEYEMTTSYHVTAEEVPNRMEEIEADEAPEVLEDGGQATVDDLKELNLGTSEDPRPIYVSTLMEKEEEDRYLQLLTEYRDVFAWNYSEMPGLDPRVALHHLAIKKGVKPKKQAQRRFRPELVPEIEKEVNKLIDADFIREVKYPTWIANIVPVRKKNGQLRVCVDFRDLNEACPKDDFPLPVTELMIDATTGHQALSFMDCTAGYNQIHMAPEDQDATAFRTPKGIFCYKVMPFGLKNAGATYQRAMQKIFEDMMHKTIECYVDDVVVKSKKRADHLQDLRAVFERLRECQLKMNPLKCAFGVTSGKFLGFIVTHRGIEVDRTKIKAIQEMPEPKCLKELRGLQGRLAYIRRFISNLAGRCQPFSHLMKKDAPFVWDEQCNKAFNNIKKYLSTAPVLGAPIQGKPLILYIAAQENSLGAMCAQKTEERKERPLYYLSRTLVGAELNYSPIEKVCLALVFAVQKLKHYMQAHTVEVVSKADPIKYILSRPVLSGRLAKWAMLLKQYDLVFVPQKAIKGQAIAEFFADHPVPDKWELSVDLPGEDIFFIDTSSPWQMFFDGAARRDGAGAGVVLVSPESHLLPYSFTFTRLCSNNVAEYQALILGLQMAKEIGVDKMDIYGDSQLVINQVLGDYEVKKDDLIPYHKHSTRLLNGFHSINIGHVPRSENKLADALANLAATLALGTEEKMSIPVCSRWVVPPPERDEVEEENEESSNVVHVREVEKEDWRQPVIDFLDRQKLPADPRHKMEIRRRAPRFFYHKGTLYRRSFQGQWLRCLGEEEAAEVVREAHAGICGAHQSGPKLHDRIKRMGYYWPTMVQDSMDFSRKCDACQFNANFIHQPPEPLHPTVASWPFEAWGLDVVGPINPKASNGHMYILAATDYFSKWAEAVTLREVKKENVVDFIKTHIIYRHGIPRRIITDNGKPFFNKLMTSLCEKFKFKQYKSSMYNAPANGLAEAFNKTLCNLLRKIVGKSKRDWHEKIGEALWAYRTTYKTPTQTTPYALVYGVEAVLPLELQIPSLRIAIQEELSSDENDKLRLAELEALDEKRLQAQQSLQCYQARLSRAFNKKVRPRSFQRGDLVLAVRRPIITSHKTGSKFKGKWDGPYVVQEIYTNGAYKIVDQDGIRVGPINGKFLKRYFS